MCDTTRRIICVGFINQCDFGNASRLLHNIIHITLRSNHHVHICMYSVYIRVQAKELVEWLLQLQELTIIANGVECEVDL